MNFDVFLRLTEAPLRAVFKRQKSRGDPFTTVTPYHAKPAELFERVRQGDASHILFMDEALEVVPKIWQLVTEINYRLGGSDPFTINCTGLEEVYGIPGDAKDTGRWPSWLLVIPRAMFERLPVDHLQYQTLEFAWLELATLCGVRTRIIGERVSLFDPFRWAADRMLDAKDEFAHDYQWYQVYQRPMELVPPQFRVTTNYEPAAIAADPGDEHKISVICPVFKSAFITQLVDSVCRQSYDNWELHLGVDGPPPAELDRIQTQIAAFPDTRIHTFVQENQGTGPTRQRLAEEATGDFIVTIDDDDMLMPDALRTFAGAIAGTPRGNVFRGGARLVGLADMPMPQNKRYLINGIATDPFEATQAYAIRRDLLLSMGGYEWDASIYNAGEDTMLFHRLDQRGEPVFLIPEVLYLRRLSTQNLTLYFRPQDALGHFKNLDEHFCPEGWKNTHRTFELDSASEDSEVQGIEMSGHFQRALAVYRHDELPAVVVTATRFYQYQTLGEVSNFVIDLALHAGSQPPYKLRQQGSTDHAAQIGLETVRALARVIAGGPRRTIVMSGVAPEGLPGQLMEMITMLQGAGQRPILHLAGLPDQDLRENLTSVQLRHYQVRQIQPDHFQANAGEANICPIARSRVFIAADGEMRLCGMDITGETNIGPIHNRNLEQMHFDKLLDYVRGKYRTFCSGCAFCPDD